MVGSMINRKEEKAEVNKFSSMFSISLGILVLVDFHHNTTKISTLPR